MVRIIFIALLCTIVSAQSLSQTTNFTDSRNDWRRSKQEIILGLGVDNFLGDLGGLDMQGTDYSIVDIELQLTAPSFMAAYRNRLSKNWAYRASFTYGKIQGDDKLTSDPYRNYRNLHFKSNIYELSQCIEYGISWDRVGKRYQIRGNKGFTNRSTYFYAYAGLGAMYFNPKARYNGAWTALQPLGTEGQVVSDTLKKYSRITATIPMGAGVRILLTKRINLGIEVSFRKVFSDYLDDVSGDYYNNDLIRGVSGSTAADLADPSSGANPEWTIQGEQRGDPTTNDAVLFAHFMISYNLTGFGNLGGKVTPKGLGGGGKRKVRGIF